MEKYRESLEIDKEIGDQRGMAKTLTQLGILLIIIENYKDAIVYLFIAYMIFYKLKLNTEKQIALQNILRLRTKIGENQFNEIIESLLSDEKDAADYNSND
jgi:hypothetical protein